MNLVLVADEIIYSYYYYLLLCERKKLSHYLQYLWFCSPILTIFHQWRKTTSS